MPGVKKLIFGSLLSIYTDLVRKEKAVEVERKRVFKEVVAATRAK